MTQYFLTDTPFCKPWLSICKYVHGSGQTFLIKNRINFIIAHKCGYFIIAKWRDRKFYHTFILKSHGYRLLMQIASDWRGTTVGSFLGSGGQFCVADKFFLTFWMTLVQKNVWENTND